MCAARLRPVSLEGGGGLFLNTASSKLYLRFQEWPVSVKTWICPGDPLVFAAIANNDSRRCLSVMRPNVNRTKSLFGHSATTRPYIFQSSLAACCSKVLTNASLLLPRAGDTTAAGHAPPGRAEDNEEGGGEPPQRPERCQRPGLQQKRGQ